MISSISAKARSSSLGEPQPDGAILPRDQIFEVIVENSKQVGSVPHV
jgi:hypothetical protein